MTPLCPILVAANAIGVSVDGDLGGRVEGSACLGGRCSWWVRDGSDETIGSCGLGNGQQYPDPATTARSDVKGEK